MNTTSLKRLLDACFVAKHVVETLPELPKGMKPRHIHVLDAVDEIQRQQGYCRVSDVSTRLNITMPSITKLIQELEKRELLFKQMAKEDKRVMLLNLTEEGRECVRLHVLEFHSAWTEQLGDISDEEVMEAIGIIRRLHDTMPGREGGKHSDGK